MVHGNGGVFSAQATVILGSSDGVTACAGPLPAPRDGSSG
jgi:hypothetical protein